MIKYKSLRLEELKEVARMNAKTFADYPLCDEIRNDFLDEDSFVDFMTEVFKVYIGAYFKKSVVIVGKEDNLIKSFAILVRPYSSDIGLFDYFRAGALKLFRTVSIPKVFKFLNVLNEGHKPCKELKKRSWFLETLAVDKLCKGQQLGSRMLKDCIIPYIKKHIKSNKSESFITFTNNAINRKFYIQNGFSEFDSTAIESNGRIIGNWSFQMSVSP
ncbi:N-acetyltransferase [Anaerosacchariphilus polymeriproducens]|uniref:N-acetyltransferase domain-containing protein n=1 Tax=Anaerosacchariphilus polymeriproducens TaxID=1812858 RepID=A0A371AX71_9FIRM|nr:GNAT family N-acetyltransferase [Anaerosacchariphilus polymeriproducens]RDU24112.1 hypothetical protein DWV06_06115 [Anaerosacchariphilus polymeriproducens]